MTPTHTTGPWCVANGLLVCASDYGRNSEIADCCPKRGPQSALRPSNDELEANARLIAAAPELLTIVKIAQEVLADAQSVAAATDNVGLAARCNGARNSLLAAIAKAEGRS